MRHNSQIRAAVLGPTKDGRRPGRDRPPRGRAGSFLGILGLRACGQERTCLAMNLLQGHEATCPHCWETISLTLDLSVPEQSYIEDCPVCCKPMLVSYSAADGELDALSVDPSD
jgi:cysteine-rich CPXCG protein